MANTNPLINHEAGIDPVLDGVGDYTEEQLVELARTTWASDVYIADDVVKESALLLTKAIVNIRRLDPNEQDSIAIMKIVDGILTTAENKADSTKDYGKEKKAELNKFNDRRNDGTDINVNKEMKLDKDVQDIRIQWTVIDGWQQACEMARQRVFTESGLAHWPKRFSRKLTRKSYASLKTYGPNHPLWTQFIRTAKADAKSRANKSKNAYIPKHDGIDDKSSADEYRVKADYNIKTTEE
jgi:hypothetical protein